MSLTMPLTARPAKRMPTPVVERPVVRQTIDLKPAGNTVALTTSADNPFAGDRNVVIVTQATTGMAPPPASMQSQSLMHRMLPGMGGLSADINPTSGPKGGVPASIARPPEAAPAGGNKTDWGAVGQGVTSLATTGASLLTSREDRRRAEAEARKAAADAAAAAAGSKASIFASSKTMLAIGVVGALGIAGLVAFLMMKKK